MTRLPSRGVHRVYNRSRRLIPTIRLLIAFGAGHLAEKFIAEIAPDRLCDVAWARRAILVDQRLTKRIRSFK